MPNGKIVAFGEIMARLEPKGYLKFVQTDEISISYTGAEANICVSLCIFGENASYVTKLPDNLITHVALSRLRAHGVDVSDVTLGGERIGTYYLERGASQRPSRILYDRKYSSMSQSVAGDYDWDKIFQGATWFHFTGITAAIGAAMPAICEEACQEAKKRGITISCDFNYRRNLWSEEQAAATMKKLVGYVDVLFGGYQDAIGFLDAQTDPGDWAADGALCQVGYTRLAKQIQEKYGCQRIIFTMRQNLSASDNKWAAMLYSGEEAYFSKEYLIHLVDRVGGGDSLCAGVIYSILNGFGPQETIEFGVAASCLKQTMERDFNLATVDEVLLLAHGDGTGRVLR